MADGVQLAKAYVTLVPSMRGMGNSIKNTLSSEVNGASIGKKLGAEMSEGAVGSFNIAGIATKVAGVVAVATAAISSLKAAWDFTQESLEAYASYEQLAGGVETLFKGSADVVKEYAQNAYMTAGMSANEYMSTVTSFSASLIQSLGGDTAAAAAKADKAITDMSDNANKMGTDIASIQNAYQGFAKANYTMLDNLKLGYGGTQAEMERLLSDAEAISGIHFDISSYADIVDAIHVIQEEMGIAGTTAAEAMDTIEGSMNALQASWSNLLTEMGKEDADVAARVEEWMDALGTYIENVGTVIARIVQNIPTMVDSFLSGLADMISGMAENTDEFVEAAGDFIGGLLTAIVTNAPKIIEALVKLLANLVVSIVTHIPDMIAGAAQLVEGLVTGLAEGVGAMFNAAVELMNGFIEGIASFFQTVFEMGANLITGLINGIISGIASLGEAIVDGVGSALGGLAEFLGIASPSKLMEQYGKYTVQGFAQGIEKNAPIVGDAMESMIDGINGTSAEMTVQGAYVAKGVASASYMPGNEISGFGNIIVYVEAREGEDAYELGTRIGSAAAYELRMQGVVA